MAIEIASSVGRIVWGHPAKSRNKTRKNPATGANEVVMKDGVAVQQWSFGVAFPKAEFQASIWPAMAQEAATLFPNGTPPKFSWKYQDGDGVDDQGKPFNAREGYAGCYVLAVSTELQAPPLYKLNGGKYDQLPADAIKCGDYVVVGLNIVANAPADRTHTPGLYMNPTLVEFIGYGTEIISQGHVDPMALLGGQQRALPAGASATPLQAAGAPGTGMLAAPQPGMVAPMAQPGMVAPMAQPGMMPAPQMMQPAPVPAPMMAPPPIVAPVGPQRPTNPAWIAPHPQTGQEMWFDGVTWAPAPVMAAPAMLPPPAMDFVAGPGGMPAPQQMMQPGMMPAPR